MMKKKGMVYLLSLIIISFILAIYILGVYNLPSKMVFSGDALYSQMIVKSIEENGLIGSLYNSRLGAPEGSSLVDFPATDWITIIEINFFSLIFNDSSVIWVVYCVFSYVLNAVTMFLLLRSLKCEYSISYVFALLFSFSTYHTSRELVHGVLGNYFVVPIAVFLTLYIASDNTEYEALSIFSKKKTMSCITMASAILLGLPNVYYAGFSLMIMAIALIYRLIRKGCQRRDVAYVRYLFILIGSMMGSVLPKILYSLIHGRNTIVAVRTPIEAEIYGLRIVQMLLPASFSRLGGLSRITAKYVNGNPYINENQCASLGVIASIGFILLCIYLWISFIKKKGSFLGDFCSLCVLTCILFATVGGFSSLFSLLITPQLRAYNRISIYILCFSLLFLAVIIKSFNCKSYIKWIVLGAFLVIAFYDQIVVAPSTGSNWDGFETQAEIYDDFYSQVEGILPEQAMVYQLPFIGFPESISIENMGCYDQLSAYIFTNDLKWSHGGVKGRNEKAHQLYQDKGMGFYFLSAVLDEGFSGICIDLDGYSIDDQSEMIHFYSDIMNLEPIISSDGSLYFYDIRKVNVNEAWEYSQEKNIANVKNIVISVLEYYDMDLSMEKALTNSIYYRTDESAQLLYASLPNHIYDLDNGDFVEECYKGILGRSSDEGGKLGKIQGLESGVSREHIVEEFMSSEEFLNRCGMSLEETIFDFVSWFGFDNGLSKGQVSELVENIGNDENMALLISNFLDKDQILNEDDYVDLLYEKLLNRKADEEGKNIKVAALSGGCSRVQIVKEIMHSEEFCQRFGGIGSY